MNNKNQFEFFIRLLDECPLIIQGAFLFMCFAPSFILKFQNIEQNLGGIAQKSVARLYKATNYSYCALKMGCFVELQYKRCRISI